MIIYTWIILCFMVLGLGIAMGKDNNEEFTIAFLRIIIVVPLIGRILGWW